MLNLTEEDSMKHTSTFLAIIISIVFCFTIFSCSDEGQMSLKKDSTSQESLEADSTKAQTSKSVDNESLNTDSDYISYESDSNKFQNSSDLYDSIEALPVSDSDKLELKNFISSLLSSTNLDMSTLMSAITQGGLSDLGINNELVQEFLILLMAGSLSGGGAIAFIEILKLVSKYMESNSGSGSGTGIDSLLNASVLQNLLSSGSIDSFVQNFLGSAFQSNVLEGIQGIFQQLHAND